MVTRCLGICLLLGLASLLGQTGCKTSTAYRGELIQPPAQRATQAAGDANRPNEDAEALEAVRERLRKNNDPYLKCHFQDGSVIVLQDWHVVDNTVSGKGLKYNSQRVVVEQSEFHIPIGSVALFETNRPEAIKSARLPIMATVATTSVALSTLCISTPKACFGSCPTIYATDGKREVLQAEGFSSSVAKALEATDVDALFEVPASWDTPELRVTNEAPETHAIRSLSLLFAPRPRQGRVYREGERYYAASALIEPSRCSNGSADCLLAVQRADAEEYKSDTDGQDLASREQLVVEFNDVPVGELGLVLTARNSLLGTYLSYQVLAYMGEDWGNYLAFIERGDPATVRTLRRIIEQLGGVEVEIAQGNGVWAKAGAHLEMGPLARETVLLKLPQTKAGVALRVRLTMTRGHMRLDRVGLVRTLGEVTPSRLVPVEVLRHQERDPDALSRLLDPGQYLVTYPGDEYVVKYPNPRCDNCEWFVESRGYYYTWMRRAWLREQDLRQVGKLLVVPAQMLKALAPSYRAIESELERIFWQSRVKVSHGTNGSAQ